MSTKNQLFLVTKEIQQCRWTSFGQQREKKIYPGHIVVIRPCNDANQFEVHKGPVSLGLPPILMTREGGLPRDRVAAISDQEFDILMAACAHYIAFAGMHKPRLDFHSSGRLMWACRLNVGDEVKVQVDKAGPTVAGVIRGTATAKASSPDYGLQFVVEITVNPSWDQYLM